MKIAKRFLVAGLLTLSVVLFVALVAFSLGVMAKELFRPAKPELAQVDD